MKKRIKLYLQKEVISELGFDNLSHVRGGYVESKDICHPITYNQETCVDKTCVNCNTNQEYLCPNTAGCFTKEIICYTGEYTKCLCQVSQDGGNSVCECVFTG